MPCMLFRTVILILCFLFLTSRHLVGGEEFIKVDIPLTEQEESLLHLYGYEISGPKTISVSVENQELHLIGQIPLIDHGGSPCFAKQKLKLPLDNLQYPLKWTEHAQHTSLVYGPHQFHFTDVESTDIQQLKEAMKGIEQTDRDHLRPAQIAKKHGYHYLMHSTRPENLFSILKDGELNPSRGKKGRLRGDPYGNNGFVFCTLLKGDADRQNMLQLTGNTLPILVFRTESVLNETKWHANMGHPLGMFCPFKTSDRQLYYSAHYTDHQRFEKFLLHPETEKRNEVVFYGPLPLVHLEKIYVKKGCKGEIVRGLGCKEIEGLIVEVEPLSPQTVDIPEWLTPYSQNSYDKVRFALSRQDYPLSDFRTLVKSEYPELAPLCEGIEKKGNISHREWFQETLKAVH